MVALYTLMAVGALSLTGQVFATTVSLPSCPSPFTPFSYSGCYTSVSNPDTLPFRGEVPRANMTVEKCQAACKGNGYRFAGLEYYGECRCGSSIGGSKVAESECGLACTGNKTQVCGGNNRLSIYEDPTFPASASVTLDDYKTIGCHVANPSLGGKALAYPVQDVTGQPWERDTGSNDKCIAGCMSKGFPYAGTEFGGECRCGVVISNGTVAAPPSECNMPCGGAPDQNCGGPSRINIFVAKGFESTEPCDHQPPNLPETSTTVSSTTIPATVPTETTTIVVPTTDAATTPTQPPTTQPPTTQPPTTLPPQTTTPTTSSAVCVSTIVTPPKCEYKCGNWCSGELPDWDDQEGCKHGYSYCKLQIAACFKYAGFPGALKCFEFAAWCGACGDYCNKTPKNKCSKQDWFKQKPPAWGPGEPSTTTITAPCEPSVTKPTKTQTTPATTSTKCPVPPTATNICKQPTNIWHGYKPGKPVGGIELPMVTCNDLKDDWHSGRPWKMYTDVDSRKCMSYPHPAVPNACRDACKEQYDDCKDTYAEGCRQMTENPGFGFDLGWPFKRSLAGRTLGWTDTWKSATDKCHAQYADCLAVNKDAAAKGKCHAWGSGWNAYIVNLPENASELAKVLFDADPRHRIFQASPLATFLRVPLSWYQSSTFPFFDDERSAAIRRTYTHPAQQASKRSFCGFCGTPLSYWSEDPPSEADFIRLTLGSLCHEDLGDLEELGLIPGSDDEASETGAATEQEGAGREMEDDAEGSKTNERNNNNNNVIAPQETFSIPWFDSLVAGSRLSRLRTTKVSGQTTSGSVKYEWEVVEWSGGDANQGPSPGYGLPSPSKRQKQNIEETVPLRQ
ncbi:hypothetical protein PpBr36_00474 [Pyricularia pennisetigena]|uniref:hypothetical protein n=1 Tax=Pyricularia pennisetigena TaxID=1578925 RepID=UPI00114F734A|nr:hypothetical protein PpBr36_00474 [Pyricularia pennisetigena]TLS29690.1 hypothetical protein PpBr36_00474 [Pyricularia pennisetigena]